jgi:hypothetical protein
MSRWLLLRGSRLTSCAALGGGRNGLRPRPSNSDGTPGLTGVVADVFVRVIATLSVRVELVQPIAFYYQIPRANRKHTQPKKYVVRQASAATVVASKSFVVVIDVCVCVPPAVSSNTEYKKHSGNSLLARTIRRGRALAVTVG